MDYYKQSKAKKQRQQLEEQVRLSEGTWWAGQGCSEHPHCFLPCPNQICSQLHEMQLRDKDGGTGWCLVITRYAYLPPWSLTAKMSTPSPSQAVRASLVKHWVFICISCRLSFFLSSIQKNAPMFQRMEPSSLPQEILERKGSALPPAGHPLRPVSIAVRRREIFLLFCSRSPPFVLWSWHLDVQMVKELPRAAETQSGTESLRHKTFAGFQVAAVHQHHQQ